VDELIDAGLSCLDCLDEGFTVMLIAPPRLDIREMPQDPAATSPGARRIHTDDTGACERERATMTTTSTEREGPT